MDVRYISDYPEMELKIWEITGFRCGHRIAVAFPKRETREYIEKIMVACPYCDDNFDFNLGTTTANGWVLVERKH